MPGIFSVADGIHEYIREQQRDDPNYKRTQGQFRSSEMGYCERQIIATFNIPFEYDATAAGYHMAGIIVEDFVKAVIQKKAKDLEIDYIIPQYSIVWNMDWEEGTEVRGKADFLMILKDKAGTQKQLVEVKSARNIDNVKEPMKHHLIQVMPYILELKPTASSIVYIDKNNLNNVKEFWVERDDMIMSYIHEKAKRLHGFQIRGEMPFAEAKYCPKCRSGKLKVDHTSRPKSATCQPPGCGATMKLDDTQLWECGYCPVKEWCDRLEQEKDKVIQLEK
jgi:hypothetical protein